MITIELDEEEFDSLIFALGYATGAAVKEKDLTQMQALLRLANAVNRHNPNWTPYPETQKGEPPSDRKLDQQR